MNQKACLLLILTATLAGCATSPIPKGYTGPKATITDSLTTRSSSQVGIFMVSRVNGKMIYTTSQATASANQGMGMGYAFTKVVSREVPAEKLSLRIEGFTQSASDFQALFAKNYTVNGDVQLDARPGAIYVVKGELSAGRQAVWIEDSSTGKL